MSDIYLVVFCSGDSSSDSSEEVDSPDVPAESTDAPAADIELRRNLGKGRGRHGRRQRDVTQEPLADGETRQPRQTREPRDATKEPCEVPRKNKVQSNFRKDLPRNKFLANHN